LKNKEVRAKKIIKEIPSARGNNSGNTYAKLLNFVTHT
jgi:hypothetical protein